MRKPSAAPVLRLLAAALVLTLTGACSTLRPTASEQPAFYSLDNAGLDAPGATAEIPKAAMAAATLIVNPPHAASGFQSQRIVYVRAAHQLEYYAHSEWIDPPAQMIAPLIVAALESRGRFRAVILTPSVASGDLRLDTEIIRLQHELGSEPSRVRLTLRAYLVDNATRRVLSWREFDESVAVASEDPYGAVVAANRGV
ncbi:ABC-type transport auxiliary lipoprotein family protein [Candidatus Accumulibacter sp. ACC007]|uniref:ABC-type transport auxiliary lipoprotein family protein n=1 Tax=Candidatus Accumulibacter sp. ACC007 TaxID=2823333 RepID=UPI0025C03649|nr:ABC-type transport auxiliary lipoprotein family protein [Candidatus Accumulibacter sp. ACC007]